MRQGQSEADIFFSRIDGFSATLAVVMPKMININFLYLYLFFLVCLIGNFSKFLEILKRLLFGIVLAPAPSMARRDSVVRSTTT
jgi:hypothetical protein